MLRKRRDRLGDASGFSLVELLVVILIIGGLAAIAVPSFLSQRDKAYDADAKAVVRSAQTAEEVAFTDADTYVSQVAGAGPTGALSELEPALVGPSAACVGTPPYAQEACGLVASATAGGFAVSVQSRTGVVFTVQRSASGQITRTCTVPAAAGQPGGCVAVAAGIGSW